MKNTPDKNKKAPAAAASTAASVKKLEMFCANEQKETSHILDIDDNGEITLTCDTCGRFTKLPATTDAKALKQYIKDHKEQNHGQVTKESIDKKKEDIFKSLGMK